ncbi:hypothetical protein [Collinsella stercoris]|uniref:hypothetical protein n=1 Tax=Collinsella stercoris TaxID=147206 RepID=UPI003A8E12B1
MNGELTERERAILDMWPKFEDGAYVWFGDGVKTHNGIAITVEAIEFSLGKVCVKDGEDGDWDTSMYAMHPLKRPAPEVLDADGVEVHDGDTVYELETGEEYKVERVFSGATDPDFPDHAIRCNKVADPITHVFKPDQLTHRHIVLDADGVEIKVGDTVWHEDGSELHVIGFGDAQNGETMLAVEYAAGPTKWGEVRCLSVTHTRPAPKVLDADGVEIEVDDRIYSIETGNSYTVRSINGSGTIEFNGFNDKGWSPKYFMHMQPTIDADGVLIKVGDTVWHHSGFAHGVVTSIDAGSLMGTVRYVNGGVEFRDAAKDLTHACPDSWERLEEDAVKVVCEYAGAVPDEFGDYDCDTCRLFDARGNLICEQLMTREIVRRAKALAGVEVDG